VPQARFITPMMWRRLSSLSKIALKVAHDCVDPQQHVRMIFASRHGEMKRTASILRDIAAREPVSPTAFSLSVLNAMPGIFGIAREDRSASLALSAGEQTLGYGLLEAFAQYEEDKTSPVLFVYADEPVDAMYHVTQHESASSALALLIGAHGSQPVGRLACSMNGSEEDPASIKEAPPPFASQHAAVRACLDTHAPSAWQNWQWSWHDGAA
jgi:hypothetical protein